MNNLHLISQHLVEVMEGGNWTDINLADSIRDVSVQEATRRLPGSPNTIASLLHHLSYWNRVMIQRIQGIKVEIPDANGFDVPELQTDHDWGMLKEDVFASARELAAAIESIDEGRLSQPIVEGSSSTYKNLQGTVEHIHYHLGQIVLLKKLVKQTELSPFS